MARLIEIAPALQSVPADLAVGVGDVLRFAASGGRVAAGTSVNLLGAYTTAIVSTSGEVLEPAGPPSTVMFQARDVGHAEIDVVTGDPYRPVETWRLRIAVEEE